MNKLLFEAISFPAPHVVEKVYEDARQWLDANPPSARPPHQDESVIRIASPDVWIPPNQDRVKCNIGFSWQERTQLAGASWVLRDHTRTILFHSRRSYAMVSTCYDARVKSWEFALESMKSLKMANVTFASTSIDLVKQLYKPREWPALRGILRNLLEMTRDQIGWELCFEKPN